VETTDDLLALLDHPVNDLFAAEDGVDQTHRLTARPHARLGVTSDVKGILVLQRRESQRG